jgi:tRNA A37 methylthiotransferase MiaB
MELPLMLNQLNANYKAELLGERLLSTPSHYAYLKISEGCNRTCSFCAIPLMRGQHVSKTIEQYSDIFGFTLYNMGFDELPSKMVEKIKG